MVHFSPSPKWLVRLLLSKVHAYNFTRVPIFLPSKPNTGAHSCKCICYILRNTVFVIRISYKVYRRLSTYYDYLLSLSIMQKVGDKANHWFSMDF